MKEVCVIGAGYHAKNNIYPSLKECGIDVVAIATRSMENSKKAVDAYSCHANAYDDYMKMLSNEKCKNVVVITQAEDAYTIVLNCLKAKKNVFCEKPLGMNLQQAQEISKTAKENDVFVMVGFMKRFSPVYTMLNDHIKSKTLGDVTSFRAMFAVDCTSWNSSQEGFVYFVIIHYLDLIRHLFGEVKELSGFVGGNQSTQISYALSVKMENGAVGTISFENQSGWTREYEAIDTTFKNGFIKTEDTTKLILHHSKSVNAPWQTLSELDYIYTPNCAPMSGTTRDLYLRGFKGEFDHFIDCSINQTLPFCNHFDNVLTTQLCEKLLNDIN